MSTLVTDNVGEAYELLQQAQLSSETAHLEIKDIPDYSLIEIHLMNVTSTVDGQDLRLRTSSDNGLNFDTSADYPSCVDFVTHSTSPSHTIYGAAGFAYVVLQTTKFGTAANEINWFKISLINPHDTNSYTVILWEASVTDDDGTRAIGYGGGLKEEQAVVNAVQLYFSSGYFNSGSYQVWGMK